MNPEVKAMWLDALRSGEYEQTQSALRSGTRFCCLGVLADLYLKSGSKCNAGWDRAGFGSIAFTYEKEKGSWVSDRDYLPLPVVRWAGLNSNNPKVNADSETRRYLSLLNDEGYPFGMIAEMIERSL